MILFRYLRDLSDVAYFPLALLFLIGIIIVYVKYRNSILFFLLSIFVFVSLVRLFHLVSSRYLLPLVVPTILLSSYCFCFKRNSYRLLSCFLLFFIFVFYSFKSFSIQEKKPYLKHIDEVLDHGQFFSNSHFQYAYCLGNIGGHIRNSSFSETNKILPVLTDLKSDNDESVLSFLDYIRENDNPDDRLLINKSVFIITTSSRNYNNFIPTWKSFFASNPKPIYSFTRSKDHRRYLVYRIDSDSFFSQCSPSSIHNIFSTNNILVNPFFTPTVFSDKQDILSFFEERDISYNKQYPFFPSDWSFYHYSWMDQAKPYHLSYDPNCLTISSSGWIGLVQKNTVFKSGHTYFAFASLDSNMESSLSFYKEHIFNKEKYFMGSCFYNINLFPGHHFLSFSFTLSPSDRDFYLNLILKNGSLSFDYLFIIDATSLNI